MNLRAASRADLPAIQALQNRLAPARRKMSLGILEDSLLAASHEHGKNAFLAFDGAELVGCCGFVRGGSGEFFVAPFFVASAIAAELLASRLLVEASGSKWVRVSCFPEEGFKRSAFESMGFKREFDFVEFEIAPSKPNAPVLPIGITECSLIEGDPVQLREVMNLSFAGVDNSLPMSEEMVAETLSSEMRDARLSLLWKNSVGHYVAYTIVNKDGYLDAIGVHPEQQKLGYGALLYKRVLAFASEKKLARIFTTVSSRNYGSLRLHAKLEIPEIERRTVYQRNL